MTPDEEREYFEYLTLKAKAAGVAPPNIQPAPEKKEPGILDAAVTPGSRGRAGILGFAQGGTFGSADEIGGLVGKLTNKGTGVQLTPQAVADARAQNIAIDERTPYEVTRDLMRQEAAQAKKEHPKTYGAGEIAGALATAPLIPGGGPLSLARAVKIGAALGAAQGLGDSTADLKRGEYGRAALDTGIGGAMGAGAAGVGYGVGRAAPVLLRGARNKMEKYALDTGRKVLTNGADQLSSRKPIADEAVRASLRTGAILPLGTTAGTLGRLERKTDVLGKTYGAIVQELEANGFEGPEARQMANEMLTRYGEEFATTGANKASANQFIDQGANLEAVAKPNGRLGLSQTESIKQDLQRQARLERLNNSSKDEALQEIASMVRQANEDAIAEQASHLPVGSEAAQIAETFVPVKRTLGPLIQAREAAERGVAAGAKRTSGGISAADVALATTTGSLLPLARKSGMSLVKGRLPSTLASGSYWSSQAAKALAEGAQRMPERGLYGAQLGAGTERALDDDIQALIDALQKK